MFGPLRIDLKILFCPPPDSGNAGDMMHHIHSPTGIFYRQRIANIAQDDLGTPVSQLSVLAPRKSADPVPARQGLLHQMSAEKPRGTGNER
jgi:hypothetical protein